MTIFKSPGFSWVFQGARFCDTFCLLHALLCWADFLCILKLEAFQELKLEDFSWLRLAQRFSASRLALEFGRASGIVSR